MKRKYNDINTELTIKKQNIFRVIYVNVEYTITKCALLHFVIVQLIAYQ